MSQHPFSVMYIRMYLNLDVTKASLKWYMILYTLTLANSKSADSAWTFSYKIVQHVLDTHADRQIH